MLRARKTKPAASSEEQGYNSSDVARICGVSLRQLQWWDERNVVSPRQDGHKRVYLAEEVVEISVIAELRRKGFSLQKIRRVLRFLQQEMGKRLSDAVANVTALLFERDLFFANAGVFRRELYGFLKKYPKTKHLVIDSAAISDIDYTALLSLEEIVSDLANDGISFSLARPDEAVRKKLRSIDNKFLKTIQLHDSVDSAVTHALAKK